MRIDEFRAMHVSGAPLVLPNAWDVASAGAVLAAGFPVVATTSGGVAAALGYEDHEHAPADEMPAKSPSSRAMRRAISSASDWLT